MLPWPNAHIVILTKYQSTFKAIISLYNQVYIHPYTQAHESKYNIIFIHLSYGRIYIIFYTHIQESFQ